ncbi:MAG: thioesterase family protein [Leptospiraceae bacterium]|nr:thioesterase family protein [Leptospiraceae bacterium]
MSKSLFPFIHKLRVRYYEVDSQGVVFNANYLNYFDTALNEVLRELSYNYLEETNKTGNEFMVKKANLDYLYPARFDDVLEISIQPYLVKAASILWVIEVKIEDTDQLICKGELTWVFINMKTRKPVKLPETFLNLS